MNVFKERFDPDIEKKLSILENVPARDPAAAARGRASFLEEAHALTLPVQHSASARNGWFGALLAAFAGNRRVHAFAFLASITLVLVMLLGGTSATVYAAQGSMPGQVLYSVKLLSEDLRLSLTSNPQAELKLISELVNRRVEEINFLVAAGDDVPDSVVNRLDAQLDQAMSIAEAIDEVTILSEIDPKSVIAPVHDRDQEAAPDPENPDEKSPKCEGVNKGNNESPGCLDISDQEPDVSGAVGPGKGSDDANDPSDPYDPYDPYEEPNEPPNGPGQPPADPPGYGPQPDEPPAYGPGPGGQCDPLPCLGPYGPGYGPDEQPVTPPSSSHGPGEGVPNPDPSSGDSGDSGDGGDSSGDGSEDSSGDGSEDSSGDGSEDSSGDGSEDSSGDSGSGSSGEDNKAP